MSEKHDIDQTDMSDDHNADDFPSNQPAINRRTLLGQLGAIGAGMGFLSSPAAATDQTASSGSDSPVRNVEHLNDDVVASYTDIALTQSTAPLANALASEEDLTVNDQTPLVFDIEPKDAEVAAYNPTLVIFTAEPTDTQTNMTSTNKAGLLNVLIMEVDGKKTPVAAFAASGTLPTSGMGAQSVDANADGSFRVYGMRENTAVQVADQTVGPSAVGTDRITTQSVQCNICTFLFGQMCGVIGTGTIGLLACMEICLPSGYAYPECVIVCRVFSYAFSEAICAGPSYGWCRNQGFC